VRSKRSDGNAEGGCGGERSRHLLQELEHGALRVLGCCDGEVDAVLQRA
jgi:hypothetical protein